MGGELSSLSGKIFTRTVGFFSGFISVIVILVLLVGGFLLFKNRSVAPTGDEMNDIDLVENDENTPPDNLGEPISTIKEFTVDASSFAFAPKTMTVNKGDTVKITVNNAGGMHDLKIDEFNAATRILKAGESETITFVADKTGVFEYYCSVGSHRAMGMVGTLTVI